MCPSIPEQLEFIEVYNPSDAPVDLTDWANLPTVSSSGLLTEPHSPHAIRLSSPLLTPAMRTCCGSSVTIIGLTNP